MKKVKLGEVCEILNGFAFKSLLYVNEGIRIIRITNVQKGYIEDSDPKYYPIEYRNSIEKYILKENDLLMSLTGNVGRVGLISKTMLPAALNQRVACLRTIDSLISKEYVFQFLNSDLFEQSAIRSSNGVAQKNLSTDWLKKVEITYPSVEQQKLITSTLNLIERLICCRKEQNKKLNELVKSRFNELFGDPVLNEMGWEKHALKEFGIWKSGGTPKKNEEKYFRGHIPWITSGELEHKYIDDSFEKITEKAIECSSAKIIEKGSLLLGMYDTAGLKSSINTKVMSCNQAIAFAKLDDKITNTIYVYYVIQNLRSMLLNQQRGVRQKNFNLSMIKNISIPLPPLSLQNEFADFVAQVDKSQLAIQKSLEELETLKKSLMQEYSG